MQKPTDKIKDLEDNSKLDPKKSFLKKILLGVIILIIILCIPLFWIHCLYPTTNPFKAISYLNYYRTHPHQNISKNTIGFAPSWQLDKMQSARFDLLTDVIYFSLTVDNNGNFVKKDSNDKDDSGWVAWNQAPANDMIAKAQIAGDRTGLTISFLNNSQIKTFLSSDPNQTNLINSTIKEIKNKHLKLINLDFEYTGEPSDEMPAQLSKFVAKMRQSLNSQVPGTILDMNLMARSGRDPALFEIEKLEPLVDNFIVMSYDYYTGGSDSAGPVAPMNGYSDKKYFFDVTTTYSDLLKQMPADKIIMGVPYYGYDWPVKDDTNPRSLALSQSDANGYVETLSYGRARADETFSGNNCHFDTLAEEPWCGYTDSTTGKNRIAWFENNQSIQIKYDFAKDQNFAGIAIWSLGYDRDYPDLWDILKQDFVINH